MLQNSANHLCVLQRFSFLPFIFFGSAIPFLSETLQLRVSETHVGRAHRAARF